MGRYAKFLANTSWWITLLVQKILFCARQNVLSGIFHWFSWRNGNKWCVFFLWQAASNKVHRGNLKLGFLWGCFLAKFIAWVRCIFYAWIICRLVVGGLNKTNKKSKDQSENEWKSSRSPKENFGRPWELFLKITRKSSALEAKHVWWLVANDSAICVHCRRFKLFLTLPGNQKWSSEWWLPSLLPLCEPTPSLQAFVQEF